MDKGINCNDSFKGGITVPLNSLLTGEILGHYIDNPFSKFHQTIEENN
jgi:hypothetical protein